MMFLRHFRKSYYSAKWPPFVFVKNLIESPGSTTSRDTWLIKYATYWASWATELPRTCCLCGTLCDCVPCYISILQLLTTVTSWEQTHSSRWCTVLIFYKKVSLSLLSFRISISHSWRPGCWEAEKHSLQNISSNGIPDPLKLHICCNYFLIAHLNPHHHICSELCYDSGTRNLIGDEIT